MWHPESHEGARKRLGKVVHATHGLRDTKGYEGGYEVAPKFGGANGKLRYLRRRGRTASQLI